MRNSLGICAGCMLSSLSKRMSRGEVYTVRQGVGKTRGDASVNKGIE